MITVALAASVRRVILVFANQKHRKCSNTTLGGCTGAPEVLLLWDRTRVPGEDLVALYESSASKHIVVVLFGQ